MARLVHLLPKIWQWWRIGLAFRRVKQADASEREFAEQALAKVMGDAKGLAMKIGQVMAGNAEDNAFLPLVQSVQPVSLKVMQPILEGHLGMVLTDVFQQFEESKAAASLGQVHHGVLLDGRVVAVKMRYPGIVQAVESELALTSRLPAGGPVKRWKINTANYKAVLHQQLLGETDYLAELQTQQRFKQHLKVPGLHIPEVFPALSCEAVLVQSWEDGSRFSEACAWSKMHRLEIGRTLLMTLFQSLFVHGEVHADPHPGNYLFRLDNSNHAETILLDYGCTVRLEKHTRLALLKLIDAYRNQQACDAFSCFIEMGFEADKLGHIQTELPSVCQLLFQPFLVDKAFPINEWQLSSAIKDLLEERRWWFRSAGPAELLLLLRAFHGLKEQLENLAIALPWWPLLQHVVGDELLQEARLFQCKSALSEAAPVLIANLAHKLCIRLSENGVQRIAIEFPAAAVFDLETLMPESVMEWISDAGINLDTIKQGLKKEGLSPQPLFNLTVENQQCLVWLE
ncbi:MAG: AarF/UbiB family protein [Methylococcaceae bacterium]|jgi:predicted unusual protein kinase regulating ubiquinone biosynthesis (AarF/ABC1/UbiB family)